MRSGSGSIPPRLWARPGNHRQKRREHDTGSAAVDRYDARAESNDGATVAAVEMLANPVVNSSRPWVFSSIETRTVTPVTIKITPHGIPRMALSSSTVRSSVSRVPMREGGHADIHTESDNTDNQHSNTAQRQPVFRLHHPASGSTANDDSTAALKEAQSTENDKTTESNDGMGERVVRIRSAIPRRRSPMRAITPLATIPVGANGDRFPPARHYPP